MPLLFFYLCIIGTIVGFFSQYHWFFDLACHFRLQYVIVFLIHIVIYWRFRKPILLGLAVFFMAVNLCVIAPFYFQRPVKTIDDYLPITLMNLNVEMDNDHYDAVINLIKSHQPDIFILEEINDKWQQGLNPLLKDYPYYHALFRNNYFGIGIFSKIPFSKSETLYFGEAKYPSILARFQIKGQEFDVLATRPISPVSNQYFLWRNDQLQKLADHRQMFLPQLIIAGDLNTSPFSHIFGQLLKKMNLKDSQLGFGLQNSWPAMAPALGVAIDHFLVSQDILVLSRQVGANVGSDHLPIFVQLGLPYKAQRTHGQEAQKVLP